MERRESEQEGEVNEWSIHFMDRRESEQEGEVSEWNIHFMERRESEREGEVNECILQGVRGEEEAELEKSLCRWLVPERKALRLALPSSKHIREWSKIGAALLWLTVEAPTLIEWGGSYFFCFQLRLVT
jgi:hypothetical protein